MLDGKSPKYLEIHKKQNQDQQGRRTHDDSNLQAARQSQIDRTKPVSDVQYIRRTHDDSNLQAAKQLKNDSTKDDPNVLYIRQAHDNSNLQAAGHSQSDRKRLRSWAEEGIGPPIRTKRIDIRGSQPAVKSRKVMDSNREAFYHVPPRSRLTKSRFL